MIGESSIKWRPTWKMWLPLVFFLIPLILEDQILGTIFTPYIYGFIVFVAGIIYYFRFRLWQSFVLMTMTTIAVCTYFLGERPEQTEAMLQMLGIYPGPNFVIWLKTYLSIPIWLVILVINFIIFYTLGPTFIKALDLEKTAIRLFKLAAREVSDEQNGFTGRPFQAGEHPYEKNQLYGLASFLEAKKICVVEFHLNGMRFIFSMGVSPLNKKLRDTLSYVSFGENGKLTVFISEHDYRQYKKEYTFDQLCELMGKTFLRFAEYHNNNFENRIISELKSV